MTEDFDNHRRIIDGSKPFQGYLIPEEIFRVFDPLKAISLFGFIKIYHRRFGQDSDSRTRPACFLSDNGR